MHVPSKGRQVTVANYFEYFISSSQLIMKSSFFLCQIWRWHTATIFQKYSKKVSVEYFQQTKFSFLYANMIHVYVPESNANDILVTLYLPPVKGQTYMYFLVWIFIIANWTTYIFNVYLNINFVSLNYCKNYLKIWDWTKKQWTTKNAWNY